jgi:hypothetical protein
VMGFFEIGSGELFAEGQLWTTVFLIAVSWRARITGMSHQHPAPSCLFFLNFDIIISL